MSELVGKIFITNDYGKFKKLKGNRTLKKNKSLENSIARSGILVPIEVNEQFEILDGQNRFEIAKKMKKPVPYRIIDGFGIEEVIDLNSTTKSWTIMDYVHKYYLDEKAEYILLKNLTEKYIKIPISSLASAAEGNLNLATKTTENIKKGNFSFYNYEVFCSFLDNYYLFLSKTRIKGGQYSFFSFFNLYTTEVFELERLIKGVANKNYDINEITNVNVVTELLLIAYNHGLTEDSKYAIAYYINKQDKPVIKTRRNTILLNMRG